MHTVPSYSIQLVQHFLLVLQLDGLQNPKRHAVLARPRHHLFQEKLRRYEPVRQGGIEILLDGGAGEEKEILVGDWKGNFDTVRKKERVSGEISLEEVLSARS